MEFAAAGQNSVTAERRLEFEVRTFSIFLPVRLRAPEGECAGNGAGDVCRAAAGDCDVAEECDGTSADCPEDERLGKGTECRSSGGICDVAEVCDGKVSECPEDGVRAEGSVCRPERGVCDVAETCDGSEVACPGDDSAPAGASCDDGMVATSGDACDSEGMCVGNMVADGAPALTSSLPADGDRRVALGVAPSFTFDVDVDADSANVARSSICDGSSAASSPSGVAWKIGRSTPAFTYRRNASQLASVSATRHLAPSCAR